MVTPQATARFTASCQFNDALPRLECGLDRRQRPRENLVEALSSAVSNAYPEQPSAVAATVCQEEQVLVLAHHDSLFARGP
jgi:hypothetical protein